MLKRINPVLPELILELVLYGIVIQLAGVWFVEDRLRYSTGLWIGIAVAAGMAINMAVVILDTVDSMAEKRASRKSAVFAVVRYFVAAAAIVITGVFNLGNLITMFIGIMGLKVAAYLQPFAHKFLMRHMEREDELSTDKMG